MKTVDSLVIELHHVLKEYRKKPYLPVWGEIFSILMQVKLIAKKSKSNILFYRLHPTGAVRYDYMKKHFVVEIPEVNVNVKDDELIDSLMKGRFHPKLGE